MKAKHIFLKNFVSKFPEMGTTIFSVMSALAQEHRAINLAQGFPEFDCPDNLKDALVEAVREGANQYAPMPGLAALREAISEKVKFAQNLSFDPVSEITVTAGATQALYTAIATLVHPGDEVLVFEPAYDSYIPAIKAFGGVPVCVPLPFPDYHFDWDLVRKKITDRTKLMIVNSPNNPCGSALSESDLLELSVLADQFSFYILSDEVYEHIVFDGLKHLSVASHPLLRHRSFVVSSFGKTFHNTGWKIGYVLAPANLMAEFRKIHQYLVFSVHHPSQVALSKILGHVDLYFSLAQFYQRKRDLFLDGIKGSSWQALACHGSYFQLLRIPDSINGSDTAIARSMTMDRKLASIPVSSFYHDKTDHRVLRFCFAKSDETLMKAAEILSSFP